MTDEKELVERLRVAHPISAQLANGSNILVEAADTITRLTAERDRARDEAFEEALRIVRAEEVPDDDPEPHVLKAMIEAGPILNARAAMRITKESIETKLLALKSAGEGAKNER